MTSGTGGVWKLPTLVLAALALFSACGKHTQYLESIDTQTMVADVNDSIHKILTITSAEDQTLKSVTFPPHSVNFFKVTAMTVNGTALKDLTGAPVNYSAINYAVRKGDVVKIDVAFAPKRFPQGDEEQIWRRVLKVLFQGSQIAHLNFNLRGISYGECTTCGTAVSGTPHTFRVEELTIHIEDPDVLTDTEQTAEAQGALIVYIDEALGKAFIKGDEFPVFTLTAPEGIKVNVVAEIGTYAGTYADGELSIYGLKEKVAGLQNLLITDLTSGTIAIPSDYENRTDVPEYADLVGLPDTVYDDTGVAYDGTTLTLVGGVIAPDEAILGVLNGGIVGFTFVLREE